MSGDLKRLRVLVGDMPRLLRDIVEDIVGSQADMEIVCRDSSVEMAAALERRDADVAVLRDTAADQAAEGRLVIVTYSERDSGAFSFRPVPIVELSPQALVQAIREACSLSPPKAS